ncbi:trypsin-2-like isoform X2 [Hermetia illucens]|uniref:trypsin-2-like isoform X2 n=1 Tax=Hermetia illucens TaxID=343691 RepID=UPI0018CC3480|nr:trypsin-2-like isoform X2 [Hermetia illucens]
MIFLRCFALMLFSLLEIQARVCSGWYARLGQFPSVVSIHRHQVFCNGVIVHLRYVLSTAHCFDDMKEYDQYTVAAGVLKVPTGESVQQVRRIINVTRYDEYNEKSRKNDYVLLRLDKPFVKTERVYPLPVGFLHGDGITNCQTAVWGVNTKNQQYTLKYINVKELDFKICSSVYPGQYAGAKFCAGATGGVDDMCQESRISAY